MKRYKLLNIIAVLLLVSTLSAQAQEERNQGIIWSYLHGWEYGIKAGFSIGGTSPLPLPEEIRKIDSYAPGGLAISIEGNATKWFDTKWGMTVGVRLENKNMTTEATVKNYGMKKKLIKEVLNWQMNLLKFFHILNLKLQKMRMYILT